MIKAEQQEQLAEAIGGKYGILCRIGGGGMAQVYLARHRLHGGLFAIKVLSEHLAQDPSIVRRFEAEARTAASLASHPNIVPIFDIGEANGLHYLVMQFIAGEDLASLLRREGRLSPVAAANVVAQATEALSCAEAKHIVHRDLKLANMLLDEGGRVKLLDFGISKIADIADGLTRPGESLGTPFYMSPEQIRGEGCDIRSDLYSLGVVFFELLSGRRPFENESATAIQIAHLSTPPPSLLALDPALPEACETIVQKLLAKRREDRYQSTSELLGALFAHGASAGPGALRPHVDQALVRAMEQPADVFPSAKAGGGMAAVPRVSAAYSAADEGEATSALADQSSLPPQQVAIAAEAARPADRFAASDPPVAVGESARRDFGKRRLRIAAASLVLLAVAAATLGWVLLRRGHAPATDLGPTSGPASVIADAHGRMLLVPAGSFLSGGEGGQPQQQVTLPSFYLDETEVSNAEYRQFVEATGHSAQAGPDFLTAPDEPVSGVSHADAAAYAAWAGKRLPTEQEWEKGARGTDGRIFPWGSAAWSGDVPTHLQPVLSEPLRRSPYGAYNMAGNVWEWTATRYVSSPAENEKMKLLTRGGSFSATWYSTKGGSFAPGGEADFRVDRRRGLPEDARSPWIGLRCVRDVPIAATP